MNSLPKYFLINFLIVPLILSNFSFAQKPTFGVKLGVALSSATINPANTDPGATSNVNRTGITGGICMDVPLTKEVVFRPGVEIVPKGGNERNNYVYYGYPLRFTYLDIPLQILYKKDNTGGHLITGGGPVFGLPIQNNYGYSLNPDVGLNGLIGYELPIGFSFNLNYCYGLLNVSKNKQLASKISTRYFGITVGYSF